MPITQIIPGTIAGPTIVASIGSKTRYGRLLLPIFAMLFIAAVACGSGGSGLPGLGDKLLLPTGGSVEVDTGDERVFIQFLSVDAESRCPQGVVCIVAGEATITLGLTLEDGGRRAFPVTIPPGASVRSEVAGFVLTLTSLLPDPPLGSMSESSYRAELVLTRP